MNQMIGVLAQHLHNTHSNELCCDIPIGISGTLHQEKSEEYSIGDKTVLFASLEARNRCVASYTFEINKTAFADDAQKWLETAHELLRHEIGNADSAAGRLLALVHEADDIFAIAVNAIEIKSVRVFDVLYVLKAALPYLNKLAVEKLFRLCAAQHDETKNDLCGGILFNELEKFFISHPDSARATRLFFKEHIAESTTGLYTAAILAVAKSISDDATSFALEDAKSNDTILRSSAIWALGQLLVSSLVAKDSIPSVSSTIIGHMADSAERVRLSAISAAAQALSVTDAFDAKLLSLGEAGDQYALAVIANALFMHTAEMKQKANFSNWFGLLPKVLPSTKGGLDSFDCVLQQMLSDPAHQKLAITSLSAWIEEHAKDIPRDKSVAELFDGTISEIANRPELLSQIITDWFLSDSGQFAAAAAGLLSHLWVRKFRDIAFSALRLDALENRDLVFLVRRMLGFVTSEEHLFSLTMSLLKTKNAEQRTFGLVHSLLVDELGMDYPSSTVEMLESAKAATIDAGLLSLYSNAMNAINDRIKKLNVLPRLAELRPPPGLQRQFSKAHAKQMEAVSEDAKKYSIMRQIATEIPIKAGLGSFSFREGSFTEPTRFHSFSTSVTLPRRHATDTVGYEIRGLMFRLAKRGDA